MTESVDDLGPKLDHLAWLLLTKPQTTNFGALGLDHEDLAGHFLFKEGALNFVDTLTAREQAVRHLQATAIRPLTATPDQLFARLQNAYIGSGQARSENLPGQAFARMHHDGELDAIELALSACAGGCDPHRVARVIGDALPLLGSVDVPQLLQAVDLLADHGLFYGSLSKWLETQPALVEPVVDGCLEKPTKSLATLLRVALIQGAATDRSTWLGRVHGLVGNANPLVARAAIEALGHIQWEKAPGDEVDAAVSVIRQWMHSSQDETNHRTAVMAGLNLATAAPGYHWLIDEIAKLDAPYITRYVGDHLAFSVHHLSAEPWYVQKVALLAARCGDQSGSFSGVDHILAQRYSTDKATCVFWLERWTQSSASREISISSDLPELFAELLSDREQLGAFLVRWLTDDQLRVQMIGHGVLNELGLIEALGLMYPPSVLDSMSAPELLHLLRRTEAHAWREEQRLSLIWSLTRMTDAQERCFATVEEAMVKAGYDYPDATQKFLTAAVQEERQSPIGVLSEKILGRIGAYYDALDPLERAEELLPRSEEHNLFAKERARMSEQASEEASKNSIMRQIATTVPVKAGRSTFSVREGQVGPTNDMVSISHSIAIARSGIIDKVGSDMLRRIIMCSKVRAR